MPQKEYARRQISSVPVDKFKSHGLDWSEPLSKPLFKQENPGPMCTQEGNTLKCYPRGTFAHPIFKEVWLSDCAYSFSHVWLFATPWTRVCQPSLPMGILQARILEWAAMPSSNWWVGKSPLRRACQPTPIFLPGESPWAEEPGGLQSMGPQRVRHNWATKHSTVAHIKNTRNNKSWQECGEKGTLVHWWENKLVQPLWKTIYRFLKSQK